MEPWQERFVKEYEELADRTHKLAVMLDKYKDGKLEFTPKCSLFLLHEQLVYMKNYLRVLEERAEVESIDLSPYKQNED